MNGFVLVIILISTFMHAGWNLLARRRRAQAYSFFHRKLAVTVLAGLAPMALAESLLGPLPLGAVGCAAGSGVFCGIYFFALAGGYVSADFTVVYPVARGLPVVALGVGDVLRGRLPTGAGWAGLAMVAGGCLLAPLRSLRGFDLRVYAHRSMLWMALAAAGTVGYTMLDKAAAEMISRGPGSAARYAYYFFLFTFLFYSILVGVFRRRRPAGPSPGWRLPAAGSLLDAGAYWLILWAYQLTARASYVVAFRQASIVIGVVAAFAIYREKGRFVRITAALVITAGLVAIALWGG